MAFYRCGGGGMPSSVKILPTISSASGSVASFSTDLQENLIRLIADITAEQASGTPTPSSPIPITGHSSCVITVKDGDNVTQNTVTIALGDTYYGGTLDVTTGVLMITHGYLYLTGALDETWNYFSVAQGNLFRHSEVTKNYTINGTNTLCNTYLPVTTRTNLTLSGSAGNFDFINDDYSDVTSWRNYLSNNPIQVVYPLTSPTSIQISSAQVETLIGDNRISASTGDVELDYLETVGHKEDLPSDLVTFKNYIKFNGTGLLLPWTINSDYKVEVVFRETTYNNDSAIIGNTQNQNRAHLTTYSNKYYTSMGSAEANFGSWSAGEHTFVNNNGNSKNEFDGVEVTNYTPTTVSEYYTIGSRGTTLTSCPYYGYIKSYKIYSISSGDLLHDLKPCKILNQACFVDAITKKFYGNDSMQAVDNVS